MCELGVDEHPGGWIMVDPWEARQSEYVETAKVLDHFAHEINEVLGGAQRPDGSRVPMRLMLLAGADLVQTMSTPGVWSPDDLDHILRGYGAFIVERAGTDIDDALASLQQYRDNIYVSHRLRSRVRDRRIIDRDYPGDPTAHLQRCQLNENQAFPTERNEYSISDPIASDRLH